MKFMTRSTEKYSPLSEETVLKLKEKHLQAAQQSNDILSWAQKEYDLLTDVEVPEEDSKQFYLFLELIRTNDNDYHQDNHLYRLLYKYLQYLL